MKEMMKLLGVIAIAAIMGFGFAACGGGDDDGGSGGGVPSECQGTYTHTDGHTIVVNEKNCVWTESGKNAITFTFDHSILTNPYTDDFYFKPSSDDILIYLCVSFWRSDKSLWSVGNNNISGESFSYYGSDVWTKNKHTHNNWDWATYTSGSGLRECQTGGCTEKAGVGDTGPAGGKIIYANATKISEYDANYLEAAPSDQGTEITWCTCINDNYCDVTTGTAIGTGKANTEAILAHTAHSSVTDENCAAKACDEYTSPDGTSDWFLPSKEEMSEMYKARSHLGISENSYWSSSQNDYIWNNGEAYDLYFYNGYYPITYKDNGLYVRAIRAF